MQQFSSNSRLNEQFIELMEQLANIMLKQGEQFRARAYQKAQETILSYSANILNPQQLKGQPGIGPTIMDKLEEYIKTGTLEILEREKNNPVNILAEVYGIGPKKAKELVDHNITTISQLRENPHMLNDVQKIGLKYYEDVLKRIPRTEIDEYKTIFNTTLPNTTFEIVGSYRRGAQSSGDIDVIITSNSANVFINFIDTLVKQKFILEILSRGPTKCLVMAKIPSSHVVRRVDFLYTSLEEFPFAILYFTGSKIFNTVMRHNAQQMGLTMNEHGLYYLNDGKKGEKVSHIFTDEQDIFHYLNMEYKKPEERIDGRAVILANKSQQIAMPQQPEKIQQTIPKLNKKTKTLKKKPTITNKSSLKKEHTEEQFIEQFKKNGISFLQNLNESQLITILNNANNLYHNETAILTDNEYDIIKEFTEKKYPPLKECIQQVGAPPITKNKVLLPYFMGSMDKIKPDTDSLTNWMSKYKGPYILSCKLDGVSALYTTEGPVPKFYTRGDGTIGQDISHLIPYLQLPTTIQNITIRGELIISKQVFETKYKTTFANPRNMVAGIVNHKTINEELLKDVHFVAYELISPIKKPSQQLAFLESLNNTNTNTNNIKSVLYDLKPSLTNELLSQTLVHLREQYLYEIDGIIVTNDEIYERKNGNPEHAFAFKMVLSDQIAEAKVVNVIWTPSKDGYLKPRVQIEPINLGGVCIEYATGFNGAFIYNNKIGIGSVVEIIRSGDVIPHIRKITVSSEKAKMPDVPYKWNDTQVDLILENIETDETVREKVLTGFFKGIGVEGLSSGNITRIMQTGYNTIPKIIKMGITDFLGVEGFKEKTATKLYEGIHNGLKKASLITIMSASNIFGRGFNEKKIEIIMEVYPDILLSNIPTSQKIKEIAEIKGMAIKSAELFVKQIPEFIQFVKDINIYDKLENTSNSININTSNPLFGKTIVMTGFRDANLQNKLKNMGVKIGSAISKNTFVVLVKNKEENTSKANEARNNNINLMTPEEFREKFL